MEGIPVDYNKEIHKNRALARGDSRDEDNSAGVVINEQTTNIAHGPLDATSALPGTSPTEAESQTDSEDEKTELHPTIPDSAASGAEEAKISKGKIRVYGKDRKVERNSKSKHRPIGPKGTIFLAANNTHIDRSRVELGKPEPHKLKIVFKDSKNNIHYRKYIDMEAENWNNAKWIADVNKWRYQVFLRAFKRDPAEVRPTRTKWTSVEKAYLEWLIRKKVKKTGKRLDPVDWRRIREKHNARWAGRRILIGEKLHLGGVAKTEQKIGERSLVALRGLVDRSEDLKQGIDEIVEDEMKEVADSDMECFGEAGDGGDENEMAVEEEGEGEDEDDYDDEEF